MRQPKKVNQPKIHSLTKENIKQFPKHIQEAFFLMGSLDQTAYLTPKYYDGLKSLKSVQLTSMFGETPDLPLKDVVVKTIGELPDFIPADKILEITAFVLRKWEALKAKELIAA